MGSKPPLSLLNEKLNVLNVLLGIKNLKLISGCELKTSLFFVAIWIIQSHLGKMFHFPVMIHFTSTLSCQVKC